MSYSIGIPIVEVDGRNIVLFLKLDLFIGKTVFLYWISFLGVNSQVGTNVLAWLCIHINTACSPLTLRLYLFYKKNPASVWCDQPVSGTVMRLIAFRVTSWQGNAFCIAGPMWGEFTGWIPGAKGQYHGVLVFSFLLVKTSWSTKKRPASDLRQHNAHVTTLQWNTCS